MRGSNDFQKKILNKLQALLLLLKELLTLDIITEKIEEMYNKRIKKRHLKHLLKHKLNYLYKKGSSTNKIGSSNRTKLLQSIFANKLLHSIYNMEILVNIDESSFNRNTKREYSCLPKGRTSSIWNMNSSGWLSMIAGILSNGDYLLFVFNQTTESDIFSYYLVVLNYILSRSVKFNNRVVRLILDNNSYHWSKDAISKINELNLNVIFLPPYSPNLAPVEQFLK